MIDLFALYVWLWFNKRQCFLLTKLLVHWIQPIGEGGRDGGLQLPLPFYKVAQIVNVVQAIALVLVFLAITSNLSRVRKLAQILEAWNQLQLVIARHGHQTRMQKYQTFLSQVFLLFVVGSVAGAFLFLSAYFLETIMVASEGQTRFMESFGPIMESINEHEFASCAGK